MFFLFFFLHLFLLFLVYPCMLRVYSLLYLLRSFSLDFSDILCRMDVLGSLVRDPFPSILLCIPISFLYIFWMIRHILLLLYESWGGKRSGFKRTLVPVDSFCNPLLFLSPRLLFSPSSSFVSWFPPLFFFFLLSCKGILLLSCIHPDCTSFCQTQLWTPAKTSSRVKRMSEAHVSLVC